MNRRTLLGLLAGIPFLGGIVTAKEKKPSLKELPSSVHRSNLKTWDGREIIFLFTSYTWDEGEVFPGSTKESEIAKRRADAIRDLRAAVNAEGAGHHEVRYRESPVQWHPMVHTVRAIYFDAYIEKGIRPIAT